MRSDLGPPRGKCLEGGGSRLKRGARAPFSCAVVDAVLELSVPTRTLTGSLAIALGLHVLAFALGFALPRRTAPLDRREEVYFTLWSPPVPTVQPESMEGASEPALPQGREAPVTEPERVSKPHARAHGSGLAAPLPRAPDPSAPASALPLAGVAPLGSADPSGTSGVSVGLPPLAATPVRREGAVGSGGEGNAGITGSGTDHGTTNGSGPGAGTASGAALVLPFGEGMSRPVLLAKIDPTYTREALAARVEGSMLVKCVITVAGSLQACRVVKGLPHMDAAVLRALSQWRYSPAMYQGGPVTVDYVIPVRLVLP